MKRILVPIDFSDVTPPVINLARQLAKALDAEIHLIHVKELTPTAFAAGMLESGLAGMPELEPVSGVPGSGFNSMPQTIPESDSQKSQLALRTRNKRKLRLDEAARCAASAICRAGVDGCGRNHRGRVRSGTIYRIDFSSNSSRNLHSRCVLPAEIGCDISRRRVWFSSAAQIRDNKHRRPATRRQTWRAAARRHSSRK